MPGTRPYTDAELDLVRKSFHGRYLLRDRCYFEMSLQLGLRVSEMLSIRVGQVWQYGHVPSELSISRSHMKGGRTQQVKPKPSGHADTCFCKPCQLSSGALKPKAPTANGRTLPVDEPTKPYILAWLARLAEMLKVQSLRDIDPSTPLFMSRVRDKHTGKRRAIAREIAWRIIKAIARDNQFDGKIATHSTRKTLAVTAERLFQDIRKVQVILGHKSTSSTQHYLSAIDEKETWGIYLEAKRAKAA